MTIAEKRQLELVNFSKKYNIELSEATRIINSYYRLCGLSERSVLASNDYDTYTKRRKYVEYLDNKCEKWIERLRGYLSPYGLYLVYAGIYPTICILDEKGGNCIKETCYNPIFY